MGTRDRTRLRKLVAATVALGVAVASFPQPLTAAVAFDPNTVVDDRDLDATVIPGSSLSAKAVAQFLASTGGALGRLTFEDEGVARTVPEIVTAAAARYQVTAQYLLALLEKEQGLVTDANPSQRQMDYATGFACPSSGCNPRYAGFAVQVRKAAEQTRAYLDDLAARNYTISGWGVGITKVTVDGIAVTPTNRATAALYTYNPLVGAYGGGDPRYGAVSLLWRLWQRWFVARHPDGSLLRQTRTGGIWLIEHGQRRPFVSRAAFLAGFDSAKVIDVPASVLALYPVGPPIRFAAVGLVSIETGGVYLLDRGVKRPIPSRSVFRALGFNPEEVTRTTAQDLADLPKGEPVTLADQFPTGKLFQIRETGGVIEIRNGQRHAVVDRAILKTRFGSVRPTPIRLAELAPYPKGEPIRFADGELVTAKGDASVYVISNGLKRPIAGRETFMRLGYRWRNVIRTSTAALALHSTGELVTSVNY